MTTTITKSVGSAMGRNYATWALFEAALPANLVTADEQWIGEGYNDSLFNSVSIVVSGQTTDATRNIIMRCATGESFTDNASKLTNKLAFDQANGVAISNVAATGNTIQIVSDYVTVQGLQIGNYSTNTTRAIYQTGGTNTFLIKDCILVGEHNSTGAGVLEISGGIAVNCLAINIGNGVVCVDQGNSEFHNVTSIQQNSSPGAWNFRGNYTSPLYKNCAAFGANAGFLSGTHASSNYNATFDTTAPGANSVQSLTYADQFEDITNSSARDFRAKAGNGLGVGTRDNTYTNDLDIVGQSRNTSTPTIGAWEFVTSGATRPVKPAGQWGGYAGSGGGFVG